MYCKLKTVVLFLQIIKKSKKTTKTTPTPTIIKPKKGAKQFSAVQKKPTFLAKGSV